MFNFRPQEMLENLQQKLDFYVKISYLSDISCRISISSCEPEGVEDYFPSSLVRESSITEPTRNFSPEFAQLHRTVSQPLYFIRLVGIPSWDPIHNPGFTASLWPIKFNLES